LAKRISEKQKQEIVDEFVKKKSLEEISENFQFTKLTIVRNLKKILGEKKYDELLKLSNSSDSSKSCKNIKHQKFASPTNQQSFDSPHMESHLEDEFLEIAPLNLEIDNLPQKDLSSISIEDVELPKMVYMVVDNQIELEIKLLRDYPQWNFLSEEDLSRNTIEIFNDMKSAKRSSKKDQKVIKVPNSNVFRITASILKARGISRIVSSESLIAL
tara:strand:+ start:182 stop:826 length:645 start_codon:yes stop_codon:yes gene_type:complete